VRRRLLEPAQQGYAQHRGLQALWRERGKEREGKRVNG
jgi:hypothetical protein